VDFYFIYILPVFFFLSGHVFDGERHPDPREFIRTRAAMLLVPYFFFIILRTALYVGHLEDGSYGLEEAVIGILFSIKTPEFMVVANAVWFLPCMFVLSVVYYALDRAPHRNVVAPVASIILGILGLHNLAYGDPLPWSIDYALFALPFYSLGHSLRGRLPRSMEGQRAVLAVVLLVSIVVTWYLYNAFYQGRSWFGMEADPYSSGFLFRTGVIYLISLPVIAAFIAAAMLLPENRGAKKLGLNTIVILAVHSLFLYALSLMFESIGVDANADPDLSIPWRIIYTALSTLLMAPLIWLMNTRFHYLLGHREPRRIHAANPVEEPSSE